MSKVTSGEQSTGSPAYEAPKVVAVGSFAADTLGDVSIGQSDDSDAGQYYTPEFAPTSRS
ncbi:lasso RiPP family leader peptide-containing protein [Streptomyces flavofungini]|uniref:lasso RiPP family leader peptide-containing protein n=1 Tax=Streptomyces flavofungini TaxID=68200 RepID=UPI0025AF1895|nr:lasso RiPP family leader peptide-containing protein [Streptomyces flavofungini]WJV51731.1 lasso RiPP family leader peptide-containing protein [Streptomyces flavofungini]